MAVKKTGSKTYELALHIPKMTLKKSPRGEAYRLESLEKDLRFPIICDNVPRIFTIKLSLQTKVKKSEAKYIRNRLMAREHMKNPQTLL